MIVALIGFGGYTDSGNWLFPLARIQNHALDLRSAQINAPNGMHGLTVSEGDWEVKEEIFELVLGQER